MTIAGGTNVPDDPRLEYPRISMETVIRLDPDVIVDVGDMGETEEEHRRRQPTTERLWRMQPHVRAAQTGAVHAVTSDAFVVPCPRVVERRRRSSAGLRLRARSSLLSVLSLRNAGWRAGATPIVERVTLDAGAGEFIALMGRNGAGQLTLLDLVAGLRIASEGSIALDGRPLSQWTARDCARDHSSSAGFARARPPDGGAAGDDGPLSARRSMVRIRR